MRNHCTTDVRNHRDLASFKRYSRGLSAIELMVTLSIVAILMTVAVPSYNNLIATSRVKSASSEIYLSLVRARSEAARLNQSVTITPNSSQWTAGWLIADGSSNTLYSENATSNVLISGGPTSVTYMSSGRVKGTTAPSFSIAASNGHGEKRCVSVDLSGRPYVKAAQC